MERGKRRMRNAAGRQATFNKRSRGVFKKASELAQLFQLQMQIDENKAEETKQEWLHANRVEELKEDVLDINRVCRQMDGLVTDSKKRESQQELKDSYEGGKDQSCSRTCDLLKKELDMLRRTALQIMGGIDEIEQKVNSIIERRQIHVRELESPLLECEHVEAQYLETTTARATEQEKSGENDQSD